MEDIIKEYYYNPNTGFKSSNKIYYHLKKDYPSITLKQVKRVIRNQETAQIHKDITNTKNKFEYEITAPPYFYQADLMFFDKLKEYNDGYYIVLNIIEIPSRKITLYVLKNKTAQTVLESFQDFINRNNIKGLTTDTGLEFNNQFLKSYLQKHNIYYTTNQQGDHNLMAVIERANRTIRQMLEKTMTAYNTKRWIDYIKQIQDNYNNTIHTSTHEIPNEMSIEEMKNQHAEKSLENAKKYADMIHEIDIGDDVRLMIAKKTFNKESEKFSKGLYKVIDIRGNKYQLQNDQGTIIKRLYPFSSLQKIDKDHIERLEL